MAKEATKTVTKKIVKKRSKAQVYSGSIYVQSTFNNTLITITDDRGNVIASASAGALGFKGAKKSTPYAAQLAMSSAVEKAKARGFHKANIFVSGVGPGRDSAVRALSSAGIEASTIKDITPIAHNGCRQKKARRV